MATDDTYTRLYNKKILPTDSLREKFLQYLVTGVRNTHQDLYPADGSFALITVTPNAGNNKIDISHSGTGRGVTGSGLTVKLGAADSRFTGIPIPPSAGTVFDVGIEQADVETGIEVNPRTGEAEYSYFTEAPGRVRNPTSVTDNGNGTITFDLSTIFPGANDHSGRKVTVWLTSRLNGGLGPLSTDVTVAFETLTVVYVGGVNKVTTAHTFGQTVVSTVATNYTIQAIGPTVKAHSLEDLTATAGCLFLAQVTAVASGNPIPGGNISTTLQNILSMAAAVGYGGGGNWADGTTNPATTVENQLDKIISDLAGAAGTGKIQGSTIDLDVPASTLASQLIAITKVADGLQAGDCFVDDFHEFRRDTWQLLTTANGVAQTPSLRENGYHYPPTAWYPVVAGDPSISNLNVGEWDWASTGKVIYCSLEALPVGLDIQSIEYSFIGPASSTATYSVQLYRRSLTTGAGSALVQGDSVVLSSSGPQQKTIVYNHTIASGFAYWISITLSVGSTVTNDALLGAIVNPVGSVAGHAVQLTLSAVTSTDSTSLLQTRYPIGNWALKPRIWQRVKINNVTDAALFHNWGLGPNNAITAQFIHDPGNSLGFGASSQIRFVIYDTTPTGFSALTGFTPVAGTYYWYTVQWFSATAAVWGIYTDPTQLPTASGTLATGGNNIRATDFYIQAAVSNIAASGGSPDTTTLIDAVNYRSQTRYMS